MNTNYLQSSALLEGLGVKPGENILFVHTHPNHIGVAVVADIETKISASKNHATQYPDIFAAIAGILRPYFGLIFLGEHYYVNTLYYDQEQTYEAI